MTGVETVFLSYFLLLQVFKTVPGTQYHVA